MHQLSVRKMSVWGDVLLSGIFVIVSTVLYCAVRLLNAHAPLSQILQRSVFVERSDTIFGIVVLELAV